MAPVWLVPPQQCEEYGDTDRGAERHTKETGHPTVSGTPAAHDTSQGRPA